MSQKQSGVNYSKSEPVKARRRSVIQRLENQLKLGTKMKKVDGKHQLLELSPKDITRINNEILTLKERT
jgi:hypothetical protein